MSAERIANLQGELLAVCRGGRFAETWRKVNGIEGQPDLRGEMSKISRARELREQIAAIDPNAALYFGWAGPGDDQPPAGFIMPFGWATKESTT